MNDAEKLEFSQYVKSRFEALSNNVIWDIEVKCSNYDYKIKATATTKVNNNVYAVQVLSECVNEFGRHRYWVLPDLYEMAMHKLFDVAFMKDPNVLPHVFLNPGRKSDG